jgi:hypothetical protein
MPDLTDDVLDFDAFLPPSPRKPIKIGGETYGVLDLFDLTRTELNQLVSFENRAEHLSEDEQYAEMKALIIKLVPKITDEKLDALSLRRLGALFTFVRRAATPEVDVPLVEHPNA